MLVVALLFGMSSCLVIDSKSSKKCFIKIGLYYKQKYATSYTEYIVNVMQYCYYI